MTKVNLTPKQFYDLLIAEMPAGIERATLRILSLHVGKENAIQKPGLLGELRKLGFGKGDNGQPLSSPTFERQVRAVIVDCRKHGHLICSSSGEGGYYIAATVEEYETFVATEYRAKIIDMSETVRAMDEGAKLAFANGRQVTQSSLF